VQRLCTLPATAEFPGPVWEPGIRAESFACRRYPHMFGYCGDVLFPTQTLSQVTEMIDSGLIGVSPFDTIDHCIEHVVATIESALQTYPPAAKKKFEVLYCLREGERMRFRFHLRHLTFDPAAAATISRLDIPDNPVLSRSSAAGPRVSE
jgi:hypothetical protein